MTPNQPLIQWAPDADPTQPGVIVDAEQLLPTQRGYAPDFALMQSSQFPLTIPTTPRGTRIQTSVSRDRRTHPGPGGAAAMVSVSACGSLPPPLVAVAVNDDAPATVGVPDRTPSADSVSPAGSEPDVTAYTGAGLPVAASVTE